MARESQSDSNDAETTRENMAEAVVGSEVLFGGRANPCEVTSHTVTLSESGVEDVRVTVETPRGATRRLEIGQSGGSYSDEKLAEKQYREGGVLDNGEWEVRSWHAIDEFEIVSVGDGVDRTDEEEELLAYEPGDEIVIQHDEIHVSGPISRIEITNGDVKASLKRDGVESPTDFEAGYSVEAHGAESYEREYHDEALRLSEVPGVGERDRDVRRFSNPKIGSTESEPSFDREALAEAFGTDPEHIQITEHEERSGEFVISAPRRHIEADTRFIANAVSDLGHEVTGGGENAEREWWVRAAPDGDEEIETDGGQPSDEDECRNGEPWCAGQIGLLDGELSCFECWLEATDEAIEAYDGDEEPEPVTDGGRVMADGGISMFDEVAESERDLASDIDETRECAMCGGEASQHDHPRYFKHVGEWRIGEWWECDECELQGNILRRRSDGEIVRIGHLFTGSGFEYPDPDEEPEAATDGGQSVADLYEIAAEAAEEKGFDATGSARYNRQRRHEAATFAVCREAERDEDLHEVCDSIDSIRGPGGFEIVSFCRRLAAELRGDDREIRADGGQRVHPEDEGVEILGDEADEEEIIEAGDDGEIITDGGTDLDEYDWSDIHVPEKGADVRITYHSARIGGSKTITGTVEHASRSASRVYDGYDDGGEMVPGASIRVRTNAVSGYVTVNTATESVHAHGEERHTSLGDLEEIQYPATDGGQIIADDPGEMWFTGECECGIRFEFSRECAEDLQRVTVDEDPADEDLFEPVARVECIGAGCGREATLYPRRLFADGGEEIRSAYDVRSRAQLLLAAIEEFKSRGYSGTALTLQYRLAALEKYLADDLTVEEIHEQIEHHEEVAAEGIDGLPSNALKARALAYEFRWILGTEAEARKISSTDGRANVFTEHGADSIGGALGVPT